MQGAPVKYSFNARLLKRSRVSQLYCKILQKNFSSNPFDRLPVLSSFGIGIGQNLKK